MVVLIDSWCEASPKGEAKHDDSPSNDGRRAVILNLLLLPENSTEIASNPTDWPRSSYSTAEKHFFDEANYNNNDSKTEADARQEWRKEFKNSNAA